MLLTTHRLLCTVRHVNQTDTPTVLKDYCLINYGTNLQMDQRVVFDFHLSLLISKGMEENWSKGFLEPPVDISGIAGVKSFQPLASLFRPENHVHLCLGSMVGTSVLAYHVTSARTRAGVVTMTTNLD